MVLVLVTGSVICSYVGESNAIGFNGMTSGNGFGSCKHDRLREMPQCYWFYLG